ncbi:MAG: CDP-2,3-bis-(O-geranylgeranyl)-sn-glycerol synthase [Candidatus Aenigmarchaeota archaeon]|nr:CDP-2,3-bis-(O-geranylgeranyl)-sn-glycerol synthase [Candidatus Aenigmarchaeota archaeon]
MVSPNIMVYFFIGIWVIMPAYFANAFAPLSRGKMRIDGGRKMFGKDIFGAGKTWEGFFLGVVAGTLFGVFEILIYPYLNVVAVSYGIQLPELSLISVFFISLGAMIGDLAGSFIKRRIGIERGESAPLLDQLDFVFGAFFFALIFIKVPAASILLIIIFTPLVHLISCAIGYKLGVKKVPW